MFRLADIPTYWRNTRTMPTLMRVFCQGFMVVSPLMLLLAALPIGNWNVNGEDLTYRQFWASTHAIVFVSAFALITIGAWGAAARNARSRWAVVLGMSVPFVLGVLLSSSGKYDWFNLVGASGMTFLIYLALFRIPSVVQYYESDNSSGRSA